MELRQAVLDAMGKGKQPANGRGSGKPLRTVECDTKVRQSMSQALPPEVPLLEWIKHRIGGEIDVSNVQGRVILHLAGNSWQERDSKWAEAESSTALWHQSQQNVEKPSGVPKRKEKKTEARKFGYCCPAPACGEHFSQWSRCLEHLRESGHVDISSMLGVQQKCMLKPQDPQRSHHRR